MLIFSVWQAAVVAEAAESETPQAILFINSLIGCYPTLITSALSYIYVHLY